MILEQYYIECLSHASYLIGDDTTGRAVVVDPRRDISDYLADAKKFGLTIEGVINTHFHADFVSGHLELVDATDAWIGFGEVAETDYPIRRLADGEHVSLGEVDLEILSTPGHTWESISVLVRERAGAEPVAVLTGDSLFIGDVGRPDLANIGDSSTSHLARAMYRTLHGTLMTLPDSVTVMPAHGAGSSCGKNLDRADVDDRGPAGEQSVGAANDRGSVRRDADRGPARRTGVLRLRRGNEQAHPPPTAGGPHRARDDTAADPRCARCGCGARCPQRRGLRRRAPARDGQRRLRRPVRRNRRHGRRRR